MLEQPKLFDTSIVNVIGHQKSNSLPIKTPKFTVSKRFFKKRDKDPRKNKIPSQICKDAKPKKKYSNEKKIPAQECKDKVASNKAKRDASTFVRYMNTGRLATPEIKTKQLKIIVSRHKFTKNTVNKSFIEPVKQYIKVLKMAGEIKIKNIKNQITQNLNELKNNPKEFLKSILLEQPEEKPKTVHLEKKEAVIEPKKPDNCAFFKIPPVDKKPLIEKMKDSLETSIETDFKQTFGDSFKQSKSKITLKALENLTKKETAMQLLTIDKEPVLTEKRKKQKDEQNETFLKKNWLLSKDNYCGEVAKKSWFPVSMAMDEYSQKKVQEKSEMLFKNMSKITRLIQPETKKNEWLNEVEFFSTQEKKEFNSKNRSTKQELMKKISKDDKSTKTTASLSRVRKEDTALIGKRKPEKFERPFITPSHVPPPKKEEEEKKKKFPPPSSKGRMILPPRNVSDNPKLSNTVEDKKIIHQEELKQQPKEIRIEKKSKVEIFSHLPRKSKDKLVYAKDSDLKKLITLEDKEHLRNNLRYILTLIEELDIEYKDGSDENLIKQSKEMDKMDKKPPNEPKLNNSNSKKIYTLTKLPPLKDKKFPDRKTQQKGDNERLDSSTENTKSKCSSVSKILETPQDKPLRGKNEPKFNKSGSKKVDTLTKLSPLNVPTQEQDFSDRRIQEKADNEHLGSSRENTKTPEDKSKVKCSSLMDFYHLDEEITSNEPIVEETYAESSLMHFYLLDEDDRIPDKSFDDPKPSELQETQGILLEKPKNKATFIKSKNIKTILPGEINKEGFKTNTFNIKEYEGIKETKQGILIEKQKKKTKNNTLKKLITSKEDESSKSVKPASKNKKTKDVKNLFVTQQEENDFVEEKYICNLPKTEKLLSYNHGVKLIFGGCYEQHAEYLTEEIDGCWKCNNIIDTTLTSDKDDKNSDKNKEKQLKKKERDSKEKDTTDDQTIKIKNDRKKRIKAPITIKEDPHKTPLVTVIYSKKRKVEKNNKTIKHEKVVYKVNKKRTGSSYRGKTRNRKRKKPKRRNIILFLLKDEIKRNEDWQAQIMDRYMSPSEKVDQALNKYKFNTPTEVSNDFNTIPSADLEMNQRKRTKERLTDSFHKNLQKKFNSKRVSKSKSDVKSEKDKEAAGKDGDKHETNSMLADNDSQSASTYETNDNCDKLCRGDKINITNNDDSNIEPKSMYIHKY